MRVHSCQLLCQRDGLLDLVPVPGYTLLGASGPLPSSAALASLKRFARFLSPRSALTGSRSPPRLHPNQSARVGMASLCSFMDLAPHLAVTGSPGPRDSPATGVVSLAVMWLWVPSGWAGSVGQAGLLCQPFKGPPSPLLLSCVVLVPRKPVWGKRSLALFLSVMTFCLELTLPVVTGRGGKPCGGGGSPQSARPPSMAQGCWSLRLDGGLPVEKGLGTGSPGPSTGSGLQTPLSPKPLQATPD